MVVSGHEGCIGLSQSCLGILEVVVGKLPFVFADDVLVVETAFVVGGELRCAYSCLGRCDCGLGLVDCGLELYLVKCEKHLSFADLLPFVNVDFGYKACHLRTDFDVCFTTECGRV